METKQAVQTSSNNKLATIKALIKTDLVQVDELITTQLASEVPLVEQICSHIIAGGGKRLRPILVILTSKLLTNKITKAHELAAVIEFVHTATLLHDDVVDGSTMRRGHDTANALWGNQASVLVGDFLYSKAFQLLTRHNNQKILSILATATNAIAEGEVLQLMNRRDAKITEKAYYAVIRRKTAQLFSAAAEIGAVVASNDAHKHQLLAEYGLHLGMAFQIIDDLLDYTADTNLLGKNLGDDLAEGKMTLPLIHALKHGNPKQTAAIRAAIKSEQSDEKPNIDLIIQAIENSGANKYCMQVAKQHQLRALKALDNLASSEYKTALVNLLEFALARQY